MKYKPTEPSTELLQQLCTNIAEEMKYVLAEICWHNRHYPENKITIEYEFGNKFADISDENKSGVTFIETIEPGDDYKYYLGLIRGYSNGLNAAGIKRHTPKEL